MTYCRGVRGATTVKSNSGAEILEATRELLIKLVEANGMDVEDVACVIFTTTNDLNAEFPALAARQMGWKDTALLCSHEMQVPGSLPYCIRVLLLYNTSKKSSELVHVYLKEAVNLRNRGIEGK